MKCQRLRERYAVKIEDVGQYRHIGGELLMMTASGEPSAYYPMDSNGLAVQNAPPQPCVCAGVAPTKSGG